MDIKTLLQSLHEHKVQFLVIGAWALPSYGFERMTSDIDIFIKPTKKNARCTIEALRSVGYLIDSEEYEELFLTKKILFRQYLLQTDVHPFAKGIDFASAWKNKKKATIKGIDVFVPSLEDLIIMKEAAGRTKDILDITMLKEYQKQEKKESK